MWTCQTAKSSRDTYKEIRAHEDKAHRIKQRTKAAVRRDPWSVSHVGNLRTWKAHKWLSRTFKCFFFSFKYKISVINYSSSFFRFQALGHLKCHGFLFVSQTKKQLKRGWRVKKQKTKPERPWTNGSISISDIWYSVSLQRERMKNRTIKARNVYSASLLRVNKTAARFQNQSQKWGTFRSRLFPEKAKIGRGPHVRMSKSTCIFSFDSHKLHSLKACWYCLRYPDHLPLNIFNK